MAWIWLLIAGAGEVIGVIGINQINREKSLPSFITLIGGFLVSFVFLSFAMQSMRMSTAYAVWTGIGTVGSTIAGMVMYKESADWRRLLFIGMILSAAVGLKLIA